MAYSFDDWKGAVDRAFVQRRMQVRTVELDDFQMFTAFKQGVAPITFVTSDFLPYKQPPPPPPAPPTNLQMAAVARGRQPDAVTHDPRYQVNTGYDMACTACGSTNVVPIGKPGTGLGFFGSVGFVIAASVVDQAIKNAQKMVFQCNYCNSKFD